MSGVTPQTRFPRTSSLSGALSAGDVVIGGLKVVSDTPVALAPVNLDESTAGTAASGGAAHPDGGRRD